MKTIITGIAMFAAAGSCVAGPVTFEYVGTSRGRNVQITVDSVFSGTVYAGSIMHRVDGQDLLTFCIDPDQAAQNKIANFERTQVWKAIDHYGEGKAKAAAIAELADSIGASLWTTGANQDIAAAFQIAVWEIIKDFSVAAASQESQWFDLDSGGFKASGGSSIFKHATNMLSSLSFTRGDGSGYIAYANDKHQDFMGQVIPTPASIALVAAGVPMLVNGRRRR